MSPALSIRTALVDDADAIAFVHVTSWRETYRGLVPDSVLDSLSVEQRADHWRKTLREVKPTLFVALVDRQVVGFVVGRERSEFGCDCELGALYLLRDHQGHGVGRALFERFVGAMRGRSLMFLWVFRENATRGFYERMGGTVAGSKTEEIGGRALEELRYEFKLRDLE